MSDVFLSIGGNLGNRLENLAICQKQLGGKLNLIGFSPIYESEAWGFDHPKDFYNQVLKCETEMPPENLLKACNAIESSMGRQRKPKPGQKYSGRIIDIDIVFYGDQIIQGKDLSIPHPGLYKRLFVLLPMHDIAPEFTDPASGKTIDQLIAACPDDSFIRKTDHPSKLIKHG
jgi:2-amino-4-hydroxy-6-hydroxymethyldihydropteridine diphosphokinase